MTLSAAFAAFLRTYPGFDYAGLRALPYRLWQEMMRAVDLSGVAKPDPDALVPAITAAITRLDDYRRRQGA